MRLGSGMGGVVDEALPARAGGRRFLGVLGRVGSPHAFCFRIRCRRPRQDHHVQSSSSGCWSSCRAAPDRSRPSCGPHAAVPARRVLVPYERRARVTGTVPARARRSSSTRAMAGLFDDPFPHSGSHRPPVSPPPLGRAIPAITEVAIPPLFGCCLCGSGTGHRTTSTGYTSEATDRGRHR